MLVVHALSDVISADPEPLSAKNWQLIANNLKQYLSHNRSMPQSQLHWFLRSKFCTARATSYS